MMPTRPERGATRPPIAVTVVWAALALVGSGLFAAGTAQAGLTRQELASAGFTAPAGRQLPLGAVLEGSGGEAATLGDRLAGRPALIAFVDYTCTTVCGVAANALAAAEAEFSGVDLDHRVLVIGFDARDGAADRARWLGDNPEAATLGAEAFVSADAETTARLVAAAGLRTVYDAEHDQFAHPAGALLVDTGGRVLRALDLMSLTPDILRSALIEASDGTAGSFVERAILSCYGWDAETGRYRPLIEGTLLAACLTTLGASLAFVGAMLLRERRQVAGSGTETPAGNAGGRHG